MTDLPSQMTAFRLAPGAPAPQLVKCPVPRPGPGEILIAVRAAGANFADQLMIGGSYQDTPDRPFTLGMELAGQIVDLGPGVDGFEPGDRVVAFCGQGAFAQYASVAASRCLPLPRPVPFDVGAAVPIAYGTSHLALERRARLRASETLLVTGAAGGVG
ncbi:MAG: alcohol dehydrogenase catalytic domain-containing protein, partial [Alphaproteobacteria bacterium]|nr:alcohol dehydrogenase catalytic domain-containing protein [Alphaproteobacteria bacterium]